MRRKLLLLAAAATLAAACWVVLPAAPGVDAPGSPKNEPIPHGQDQMPGPPLSPADAVKKMTVPDGFTVELVASEPDIVNPIAMTFDERGRIWITESLEYPRSSAGAGKDRIKILEDTHGDGKFDKVTVFADGLNIPSGLNLGYGGAWVANSPDILFLQDTQGTGKADKREVVVTGFGRFDTHELPNSLTWGPDGWLYGWNGVFNPAHVVQNGKTFDFTCALFRIHPRTREFQIFAEGTSNPWAITWNGEGEAFASACVIDHLWHISESGYYIRQGGPYPPFTWPKDSIVKERHQKAAYCGILCFDSDAFPEEYRGKLFMGNIHGGCINVDEIKPDGSTYAGTARPDFLTANDQWFMPVSQKVGPDGCLYILDWYDRYHCYQDANRDPAGIDRDKGRIYRVRYKNSPRAPKFDLAKETDDQLVEHLHSPNIYFRETAQRLLTERATPEVKAKLEKLVLDEEAPRKARMQALWTRISCGPLEPALQEKLLVHKDPGFRAWAVRAAGNEGKVDDAVRAKILSMVRDPSREVQVQWAIAVRKIDGAKAIPELMLMLDYCGDDKLIPHIVWQNLHPLLEDHADEFVRALKEMNLANSPNVAQITPRAFERILGRKQFDAALLAEFFAAFLFHDAYPARQCLEMLAGKLQTGEIAGANADALRDKFKPILAKLLAGNPSGALYFDSALLAATWKDPAGLAVARKIASATELAAGDRLKAINALVAAHDSTALQVAAAVLGDAKANPQLFRGQMLDALGRLEERGVADVVLSAYPNMEPDLQPRAIELLTQRTAWSKPLLAAIADKKIPTSALSVNHVRKLLAGKDPDVIKQVKATWGVLREERNPQREKVVADMKDLLSRTKGDAQAGVPVFKKLCAQCHKIHGEGQDVGPDITVNGRSTFDQMLSNVFDPSLVIGAAYQATNVVTVQGRSLTGLLVEDSPKRVVLKLQGGKLETIPRDDIDMISVSKVSLMPEDVEKQLKPQEIADLFAFLALDKPPSDPSARKIPGTPNPR
jgi:putative membrane-bound dehydrogenase-like protein